MIGPRIHVTVPICINKNMHELQINNYHCDLHKNKHHITTLKAVNNQEQPSFTITWKFLPLSKSVGPY